MPTAALMIQGTNSNAGKSVLVAGLCRAFTARGLSVQPFKPQNMSNNAAAVPGGGEIGRAQALQARAARVGLSVHQNPVLLKPESDTNSQVVVQGHPAGNLRSTEFREARSELLGKVLESFEVVSSTADLVIIEGAGSPAETNLRAGDIANMGFATVTDVPVVLAGDIDRGGVIASLVGTDAVLSDEDRQQIKGFLINKFRGDVSLFDTGLADVTDRTGWPSLGVVTWCRALSKLPAEDAVELENRSGSDGLNGRFRIAVPMLSRIANFDDVDPLKLEPGVDLAMIPPGRPLPICDLIIIPGTKATIADLAFFREQGWHLDLAAHVRRGGRVVGLCGGYQMLGSSIDDPTGVEGEPGRVDGLGLLGIATVLHKEKVTKPVSGVHRQSGETVTGYEIHVGTSTGEATERPWLVIGGRPEGASSADGLVAGSYVHGVFGSDEFRAAYLRSNGAVSSVAYEKTVDEVLDSWAEQLEQELDLQSMLEIARLRP